MVAVAVLVAVGLTPTVIEAVLELVGEGVVDADRVGLREGVAVGE